jgi:predicted chitinase
MPAGKHTESTEVSMRWVMMLPKKAVQKTVATIFKRHDVEFVNELARLLLLYGDDFKINTTKRLAMFLTHVKAELDVSRSGKVRMRESMNYSAKRLKVVFKNFRKSPALANRWGRTKSHSANQRAIADYAYANRLGNGDYDSGDGWRYRGAGVLQTTGRYNFERDLAAVEKVTGMVLHDLKGAFDTTWADNYTIGVLLGMANWLNNKMYTAKSIDASTRIINYYTDSYAKRRRIYAKAKKIAQRYA